MDMFPADTICGVITHFYHAEAIRESKVKLYEGYSSTLPKMDIRRDGPCKKAYVSECVDILRALKDIDAKFGPNRPIVYVSQNIRNLPAVAPGETDTISILNRLCKLERQMTSSINASTSYTNATQKTPTPRPTPNPRSRSSSRDQSPGPPDQRGMLHVLGPTDQSGTGLLAPRDQSGLANPVSPTEPSGLLDLPGHPESEDDDGFTLSPHERKKRRRQERRMMEEQTSVMQPYTQPTQQPLEEERTYVKRLYTPPAQQPQAGPAIRLDGPSTTAPTYRRGQRPPDRMLAGARNRSRRPEVRGTRTSDCLIRAGPITKDLFVSRVSSEHTEQDVKNFLEGENVHVLDIVQISQPESYTISFHVTVQMSHDAEKLMEPDFWPYGVCCRRFYRRNRNNNH